MKYAAIGIGFLIVFYFCIQIFNEVHAWLGIGLFVATLFLIWHLINKKIKKNS